MREEKFERLIHEWKVRRQTIADEGFRAVQQKQYKKAAECADKLEALDLCIGELQAVVLDV